MLHDHPEIAIYVKGISTVVVPFGIKSVSGKVRFHQNQVHLFDPHPSSSEFLFNCFVGWVENTPVIRSGIIDTKEKAEVFLAVAQKAHHEMGREIPFRLSSNQLNYAEFEWNRIVAQHQSLILAAKELEGVVHLSMPIDDFYSLHPHVRHLKRELQAFDKLPKLQNMESWIVYCGWYNELLQEAFRHFSYDAIDEYTLEEYLENFKHEVNSQFLEMTKGRIKELEGILLSSTNLTYSEQVKIDEELLRARYEITRLIRAQYDNLVEIIRLIGIIEGAHPELLHLKHVGMILASLLAGEADIPEKEMPLWTEKQMLLQLLDDELGVISAVNCEHGVDRTNMAFAIRLAALQLKKRSTEFEAIDLALHLEKTARELNKIMATYGDKEVRAQVEKHHDPQFRKRVPLLHTFRDCFMKNLIEICFPITKLNTKGVLPLRNPELHENVNYLDLLPHKFVLLNEIGEQEKVELVNYHADSGEPAGLTEAGHRFLSSLSLSLLNI